MSVAKRDFYETLGVSQTASADELKKAYRRMAMKYHPDKNAGDPEAEKQFKEVNEAWETLSDPEKRAAYDRFGHAATEAGFAGAGGARAGGADFGDVFSDVFSDFFGGATRGGGRRRNRGQDLQYNLTITLTQAAGGDGQPSDDAAV